MPRFFIDKTDISDDGLTVTVRGDDARHIARSLRMAVGEQITACCEGTDYTCRLDVIRDEAVTAAVLSSVPSASEPPYSVTVYQALVKGERMDTAVQKCVEFGAARIVPFESSRCIVRLKDCGTEDKKDQRRRRIAEEAAKQCGRGLVPEAAAPVKFGEALRLAAQADVALFCWEDEHTRKLGQLLTSYRSQKGTPRTVSVMVGPEGGFSADEAGEAEKAGLIPVSLGARILRTESAAPFALAALCTIFELE